MAQIITIGKNRWVVGMSWASFEDRPTKEDVKEEGARFKADWSCLRIGEASIQAGFCAAVPNTKSMRGMKSLAAMLADSQKDPWMGTFKISEGLWWFIAVRDNHAILPRGDIIGGEDEILAARDEYSGFDDWNYLKGSSLEELSAHIDGIKAKPTPVRAIVAPAIPVLPVVAAVGLLVLVAGGWTYWDNKQAEEAQQKIVAMAKMKAQLASNQPLVVIPSPLLTTPTPDAWLDACDKIVNNVPLAVDGWMLDHISCGGSTVTIGRVRSEGATVAVKPEGAVSSQGDRIDQNIALAAVKPSGRDDSANLGDAKMMLRAWAQTGGFALSMSDPVQPAAVLPGTAPSTLPPAIPQSNFTMIVPISPFGLSLSQIPGLRLTRIATAEKGWTIEGVIYGN